MKPRELIVILLSAVIECILTFVLTQVFALGNWGMLAIFTVNVIVLLSIYLWFNRKEKKHAEIEDILREMNIVSHEDLTAHRDLHARLDLLGMVNCTEKLTDTLFAPITCTSNIKKTLYFMGVAGSKWVNDPPVLVQFERMLQKVSAAQGEVKFLLINPRGDGWQKLKRLRRDRLSDESYPKFKELASKYPCLKVRLYDSLPSFRLQFVDNSYVTVSRYKFEFSEYEATHYGWDAPHLIVKNEEPELSTGNIRHFWSLYMAFQYLYDHIWNHSKDLSTLEL